MGTATTIYVLGNDTDADSNALTITAVTPAAHGTVTISSNSSVRYTPYAGYFGTDSFGYTTSDGNGGSDTATVTVNVLSANRPPSAMDDSISIPAGTSFTIVVLANDSDPDGNGFTITAVTQGDHGTVTIIDNKTRLLYEPVNGYVGTDSFDYTISDEKGATATATVTVTVLPGRAASLVAAYNFDETSGSRVIDISGHNNIGTLGTGVTRSSQGKFGSALVFNGSSVVTIPAATSLNLSTAMTLEAWVYPTRTQPTWPAVIVKERAYTGWVYALYANSDQSRPFMGIYINRERSLTGGPRLPISTWSHLAATYDGTTERLYVNGVEVARRSQSGLIQTSTLPVRLGGNTITRDYFRGRIDEVRIYNTVLSPVEIQADMLNSIK
jgi:hypothetical protein